MADYKPLEIYTRFMACIPKTLRDFKIAFEDSLSENIDATDHYNSSHLKVQLVESNISEIPQINDFSTWRSFEDTSNWYYCDSNADYIVINRFSQRVWAVFSLMKIESFSRVMDSWIKNSLNLDKCWISSTRIKKIGIDNSWAERGIGLRYYDLLADEDSQSKVSLKAWYGPNDVISEIIGKLQNHFAVSSYRFKDNATSTVSEWYSNGKITFNSSDDSDVVLDCVFKAMRYYDEELGRATKLRNESKGCFEFEFSQAVDLERYSDLVGKGKSELQLWLSEIQSLPDFRRYRGVDMHTWDRIFLDIGDTYAYMTVPGKGCVNAAPRFVSVQGETILGKTQVYYNGDEVFG